MVPETDGGQIHVAVRAVAAVHIDDRQEVLVAGLPEPLALVGGRLLTQRGRPVQEIVALDGHAAIVSPLVAGVNGSGVALRGPRCYGGQPWQSFAPKP